MSKKPRSSFVTPPQGGIVAAAENVIFHGSRGKKLTHTSSKAWSVWRYKMLEEGTFETWHQDMMSDFRRKKAEFEAGTIPNKPMWQAHECEWRAKAGFSVEAAREWWRHFTRKLTVQERDEWFTRVVGEEEKVVKRRGKDDWRRDDMPEDVAWVAARPCLTEEQEDPERPRRLGADDFVGCPSPQAKALLVFAYNNQAKFFQMLLDTFKQQYGKRKVETPAETQAAVAAKVEEKKAELPPPPKPLDKSEASLLVAKLLGENG